ncbi:MAG: hypothetical protein ACPG8W_03250 [Candidatus Promineifilaceae bacterium]
MYRHLLLLLGFILAVIALPSLLAQASTEQPEIPIIELTRAGFDPINARDLLGQDNSTGWLFAPLQKYGATYVSPQAATQFEIVVSNYDRYPHHYWVRETLPSELQFVSAENDALQYNPSTRQLTWFGSIYPGQLEYIIEPATLQLPYIDLAAYNVPTSCDLAISLHGNCDDAIITYNFGALNYTASLFGSSQRQLSLSTNGMILGGQESSATNHPRWLPNWETPNFSVAGLWQDLDMTSAGRWHVAILQGYIEDHDVFYAQWHDAPHKYNPNLTSRFAIAVILDGEGGLNGHVFYLYDLISDPAALAAEGYTIGIEDSIGSRGATYAHAPCCGSWTTPQGFPPTSNFSLHLKPHLLGTNYSQSLKYTAIVDAQVPETVVSTVTAVSDLADPAINNVWASHYLYVREQRFIPIIQR